ncbi:hypothetical protein AB0M02_38250 [Actinoplanes sp. NPDC051861]|uniref:hypothetical protein n=1 Tax=Actinoplanes sp. NPDC051861 TaxID=3155170 RepID=UPI003446883A
MTDEEELERLQAFADRFCPQLGIEPPRFTLEQVRAHRERMRDGDAQVAAILARRQARNNT